MLGAAKDLWLRRGLGSAGGEWGGDGGLQISNRSGEASLRSRRFGKDLREIDSRPCVYLGRSREQAMRRVPV